MSILILWILFLIVSLDSLSEHIIIKFDLDQSVYTTSHNDANVTRKTTIPKYSPHPGSSSGKRWQRICAVRQWFNHARQENGRQEISHRKCPFETSQTGEWRKSFETSNDDVNIEKRHS